MLFAAIDIGSNASRLLFANVFEIEGRPLVEKATLVRIPTRLGEDVYSMGSVSTEKADNLIKTLRAYKLLLEVYRPLQFTAVATAAIRDAKNRERIMERIKVESGIDVRVINGMKEAEIIRSTNNITFNNQKRHTMFIDVGGGSTEISLLSSDSVVAAKSFRIGTLRILNNTVPDGEWDTMEQWLQTFGQHFGDINCIGTGGNINKINKLYGDTDSFQLTFRSLQHAYRHLSSFSLTERIQKLGLRPDRADVIVPAGYIFIRIMKTIKSGIVYVPQIGLADGLIHQMYQNKRKQNRS